MFSWQCGIRVVHSQASPRDKVRNTASIFPSFRQAPGGMRHLPGQDDAFRLLQRVCASNKLWGFGLACSSWDSGEAKVVSGLSGVSEMAPLLLATFRSEPITTAHQCLLSLSMSYSAQVRMNGHGHNLIHAGIISQLSKRSSNEVLRFE
jgi:hypothetical protein